MTDQEFIEQVKSITFTTQRDSIRMLAEQPQFKTFLIKALGEDGCTYNDEYYLYSYEDEIAHVIGSRISMFDALCSGLNIDVTEEESEYYTFPCEARSFVLDGKRYWMMTMEGQGVVTWIMTDERFIKEYGV